VAHQRLQQQHRLRLQQAGTCPLSPLLQVDTYCQTQQQQQQEEAGTCLQRQHQLLC
jgi:hypothetical protein